MPREFSEGIKNFIVFVLIVSKKRKGTVYGKYVYYVTLFEKKNRRGNLFIKNWYDLDLCYTTNFFSSFFFLF